MPAESPQEHRQITERTPLLLHCKNVIISPQECCRFTARTLSLHRKNDIKIPQNQKNKNRHFTYHNRITARMPSLYCKNACRITTRTPVMPLLHRMNAVTSPHERCYFTARMSSFHRKNGVTSPQERRRNTA